MSDTADKAKSLFDEFKDYHDDARRVLPVLVRQARASEPIEYGVVASEIGVNGARNMGYPLGCVGNTLIELGERWGEHIPPIQFVVVNKEDGLPGEGVTHFAPDPTRFARATKAEKRVIVREILHEVFVYSRWDRVLAELSLAPLPLIAMPEPGNTTRRRGGGEGREHRALKMFVSKHPEIVGAGATAGQVEADLRSADVIDVIFRGRRRTVAVEVKGPKSDLNDIIRGVFQCVKYRTLLEAEAKVAGRRLDVEAVLVLGGPLPSDARSVANTLGIRVVQNVTVP